MTAVGGAGRPAGGPAGRASCVARSDAPGQTGLTGRRRGPAGGAGRERVARVTAGQTGKSPAGQTGQPAGGGRPAGVGRPAGRPGDGERAGPAGRPGPATAGAGPYAASTSSAAGPTSASASVTESREARSAWGAGGAP